MLRGRLTAAVSSLSSRRTFMSLNVPERLTFSNSLTMCHPPKYFISQPNIYLCLCITETNVAQNNAQPFYEQRILIDFPLFLIF